MFNRSDNNNYIFIITFLFSTFILDRSLGFFLEKLYFSDAAINNEKLSYCTLKTDAEVLIFGSSRAENHYNPTIITETTKMSCYNMGFGGQNIYFHNALLKCVLERYAPKIIVLDLFNIDFEKTLPSHDKEKLGVLLPFYRRSETLKKAVLFRGESEKFKTLSDIYPFNSTIYQIIRNNYWPLHNKINGFIPISREWQKEIEVVDNLDVELDTEKIKVLFDFIKSTRVKGCTVIIAVSPFLGIKTKDESLKKVSEKILKKFGLVVINFEQDSRFFRNSKLFADPVHLNDEGAKLYSRFIANEISKITKKSSID